MNWVLPVGFAMIFTSLAFAIASILVNVYTLPHLIIPLSIAFGGYLGLLIYSLLRYPKQPLKQLPPRSYSITGCMLGMYIGLFLSHIFPINPAIFIIPSVSFLGTFLANKGKNTLKERSKIDDEADINPKHMKSTKTSEEKQNRTPFMAPGGTLGLMLGAAIGGLFIPGPGFATGAAAGLAIGLLVGRFSIHLKPMQKLRELLDYSRTTQICSKAASITAFIIANSIGAVIAITAFGADAAVGGIFGSLLSANFTATSVCLIAGVLGVFIAGPIAAYFSKRLQQRKEVAQKVDDKGKSYQQISQSLSDQENDEKPQNIEKPADIKSLKLRVALTFSQAGAFFGIVLGACIGNLILPGIGAAIGSAVGSACLASFMAVGSYFASSNNPKNYYSNISAGVNCLGGAKVGMYLGGASFLVFGLSKYLGATIFGAVGMVIFATITGMYYWLDNWKKSNNYNTTDARSFTPRQQNTSDSCSLDKRAIHGVSGANRPEARESGADVDDAAFVPS